MHLLMRYPKLTLFLTCLIYRFVALYSVFPPNYWVDLEGAFELGQVAANIAEGRGFSSPFENGSTPTAWFAPLIPLLWAGLFRLFGTFSPASLATIYSLQIMARALSSVVYFQIGRKVLRRPDRRLPLITALVITLWPDHFIVTTRPWYWAWQELGVALVIYLGLIFTEHGRIRSAVALGAAAGATLLVNVTPLPIYLFILSVNLRRSFAGVALSIALSLGLIAPWMVRNYLVLDQIVPLRSNMPVELLQGNNERGSIIQSKASLHPNVDKKERERYQELGEMGYVDEAKERFWSYIKTHPSELFGRTASRMVMFWLTDLVTDEVYGGTSWGVKTRTERFTTLLVLLQALLPLMALFWAIAFGRLFTLPKWQLLASPLAILPLPYYLTHIHPTYQASVRPYLLLLPLLSMAKRRKAEVIQLEPVQEGLRQAS